MRQENYRDLGGQVKHVLWTIEALHKRGFWLEVLTLVIPGFNDSTEELWGRGPVHRRYFDGYSVARGRPSTRITK